MSTRYTGTGERINIEVALKYSVSVVRVFHSFRNCSRRFFYLLLAAANICSCYRIRRTVRRLPIFMFCSSAWATRTVALYLSAQMCRSMRSPVYVKIKQFSPTCDVPSVSVSYEPKCGKIYTEPRWMKMDDGFTQ